MKRPSKKSVQNAIVDIATVQDKVEITTPETVEEIVVDEVQIETAEPEQIAVEEIIVEEPVIEEPEVQVAEVVVEAPKPSFQIRLDDKLFGVTLSNGALNWQAAYDWADATGNSLPDKDIIGKVYLQAKESFGIGEWWSASRVDDDKAWVIDFVKKHRSAKRVKEGAFAFYLTEI